MGERVHTDIGTAGTASRLERGRSEAPVRARLLQAIFERRLLPGEKLTEDRLAALFGVSRTVIRQALGRLAQDGIVEQHPHRGAYVAAPSRADARHVMAARSVVEPAVVAAATIGADADSVARLRRHVAEEDAARADGDRAALIRLTGEFHVLLAEIAGNPVFLRLTTELHALSSLAILLYAHGGHESCPPAEHARIVDAIARRDAEGAARLMREHLGHVEADMDLAEPPARSGDLAEALGLAGAARHAKTE